MTKYEGDAWDGLRLLIEKRSEKKSRVPAQLQKVAGQASDKARSTWDKIPATDNLEETLEKALAGLEVVSGRRWPGVRSVRSRCSATTPLRRLFSDEAGDPDSWKSTPERRAQIGGREDARARTCQPSSFQLMTMAGCRGGRHQAVPPCARIASMKLATRLLLTALLALAAAACGDDSEPEGEPGGTTTTTAPSLGY